MELRSVLPLGYAFLWNEWEKWRFCWQGGEAFVEKYCVKFSARESEYDFKTRKQVTYNPAFAKKAVREVCNGILQRAIDIVRTGGSASYEKAIVGKEGGVDLLGSTMSHFMCVKVLQELAIMGEVGIYVDMPPIPEDATMADTGKARPYVYIYPREDIVATRYDLGHAANEFSSVILIDREYEDDDDIGFCDTIKTRYRLLRVKEVIIDGRVQRRVFASFMDRETGTPELTANNVKLDFKDEVMLNIERIPFIKLSIGESLLADIAQYQVALMNMASSDVTFCLKASHPFYVEPYDPRSESPYLKPPGSYAPVTNNYEQDPDDTGLSYESTTTNPTAVGILSGRRYAQGQNEPSFIHPSPEPLLASMKKQDQMKAEITQLAHLAVASLGQSAEAKKEDKGALEDGLAFLARVLEKGENDIAALWAMYETSKTAQVSYPECYSIQSGSDLREEIKLDLEVAEKSSSLTFKKEIHKKIADKLLARRLSRDKFEALLKEIQGLEVVFADYLAIQSDMEQGLVDPETASLARGYPKGTVEKAKEAHAERVALIQASQAKGQGTGSMADGQARGTPDTGANPTAGRQEKKQSRDNTLKSVPADNTRGQGK